MAKPPGSFGWFGGATDSATMASDPVAFIKGKTDKHGGVFCAKIAGSPCVFASGHDHAKKMFADVDRFPPSSSLVQMIKNAVGDPFLLHNSPEAVAFWRDAVSQALYEQTSPQSSIHPPSLPPLRAEVRQKLMEVVEKRVRAWAATPPANLYKSAKHLGNDVLLQLFLGVTLEEAEKDGVTGLQTQQFRGCESVPVEGVPFMESTYEAGVKSRTSLVDYVKRRVSAKTLGIVGADVVRRAQEAAQAVGATPEAGVPAPPAVTPLAVAEVLAYLLHGMVPKALGSFLLYAWAELSRYPEKRKVVQGVDTFFANEFLTEVARLHSPVGLMGRGVRCPAFAGYKLDTTKHGEWKGFVGIDAANKDAATYAKPEVFDPSRWEKNEGAKPPPFPVTFGAGPRGCFGAVLSWDLVVVATRTLFLQCACYPIITYPTPSEEKSRPVKRPLSDIKCTFRKISAASMPTLDPTPDAASPAPTKHVDPTSG